MPIIWNISARAMCRRKYDGCRYRGTSAVLFIALISCAGCHHATHRYSANSTVKSVADFRQVLVGSWCLPIRKNHRILKATINFSGHYVLSYSASSATAEQAWIETAQGTVTYGKGISAIDRSTYYFAHLASTAVNFGISAGSRESEIAAEGIPVLVNEAGFGRDNDRLRYWTRNCRLPASTS